MGEDVPSDVATGRRSLLSSRAAPYSIHSARNKPRMTNAFDSSIRP